MQSCYEYDTMGRETSRVHRNGVKQETFYDKAGRVVLIKETNTYRDILRAEGYLYDEKGRRSYSVDEAGNVTAYTYDNQSRLAAVLYPWTDEITVADKQEAAEAGLFFANDKGSPERFSVPLADLAKLRELLNRAQYNRGSLVMFNQLLWRQSFTYDANGNRATKTTPWGTIRYEYDRENRLVKKGNIVYAYDMDGNLLSKTGGYRSAEYRYNGQNRMTYSGVTDHTNGATAVSEYAYDAFGRRTIAQEAGRTAMRTLYDGFTFEAIRESETFQYGGFTVRTSPGAVLPAVPSSTPGIVEEGRFRQVTEGYSTWLGNSPPQGRSGGEAAVPEYRYVGINATLYANGEAVAMNRYDTDTYTGGTVYLGKDVLGSVRGISNEYGLLEECYEYDALGTPYKGDLNSGINLGYTGKPYDTATGLYNYGYRDYQPEAARFTTVDPIRDGTNWFAYVNNDPVNWIDLWGLDSMYSTYIQGTGIMVSTYVPNNPNGSIDYENIRTYSFSAANNVSSKPTTTIPADKNETPEYYYPQTFPAGTWDVQISRTVSPDEKNAPQLGTVYVNTTAQQTVPTYGATAPLPGAAPTNTQIDSAYGIHYKENGITAGCIAIGSQKEAEQFAALSDQALRSENGKSTITVTKGK